MTPPRPRAPDPSPRGAALLALLLAACGSKVDVDRAPAPPLAYQADLELRALGEGRVLGQVAGLALDASGALWVFHRAGAGFDNTELITQPTLAVFDADSGALLRELGAGLFVTPHGLTIDAVGHVWVTDTGQDRVFELSSSGEVLHVYDGR
jgi:DNA-binding beta-propeller fold protein YncE